MQPFSTPKVLKRTAKMPHWKLFFTKKGQPLTSFWVSSGQYLISSLVTINGGAVASWLVLSGSSGLSSSPGQGHCAVFLSKTLCSHSAYLHPSVLMGTSNFNARGNPERKGLVPHPGGSRKTPSHTGISSGLLGLTWLVCSFYVP